MGWLATPSAGAAPTSIAPPGKSGADQYFETVPSARGNVAPPTASNGAAGVGTAGERRLAALGKDGRAAASLAQAGARRGGQTQAAGARSTGANSTANNLGRLVGGSDSGGIGIWLPILLGASLLGAILFALKRRRHSEAS